MLVSAVLQAQPVTYPASFTVAQDGSGQFTTIGQAINAVRDLSQQQVTIFIKKGVYHEKLVIPSWKTNIALVGEDAAQTIITNSDYTGKPQPVSANVLTKDTFRTFTSYTVLIQGQDCMLKNLTIQNAAGRVGQGVALHVEGDRCSIINCRLLGNQDTLYAATDGSRQYYQDCYIEGTTDFIFGEATAVFQHCTIKSLVNSFITAASTRPGRRYGFVFFDCNLIADTAAKQVYLGRPWRPYAKTVYIRTQMGAHIIPAGWDNWRNPANEKTAFFAEYQSSGAGGVSAARVKWSKQLTATENNEYTLAAIFAGAVPWDPLKN